MRQQPSSYRGRALAEAEVQDFEYSAGAQALRAHRNLCGTAHCLDTTRSRSRSPCAIPGRTTRTGRAALVAPEKLQIATQTANGGKRKGNQRLVLIRAPAPKAPALPDSAAPHPKVERVLFVRDTRNDWGRMAGSL